MPAELADLRIDARWIAPMTGEDDLLAAHSVLVRDGKIVAILPTPEAVTRFAAATVVERPAHLVLPGLIDGDSRASHSLLPPAEAHGAGESLGPDFAYDSVMRAMAEMVRGGITCFVDRSFMPDEAARAAHDHGMRALIGLPIATQASAWAESGAKYVSRALALRDEYRSHPLIFTCFAPLALNSLDATLLTQIATLTNELDAAIILDLHQNGAEIEQSERRFGLRPIERLQGLGLLAPSLVALQPGLINEADLELAQRGGIGACLSTRLSLSPGRVAPILPRLARAGMSIGLASAGALTLRYDMWEEMRLAALQLGASPRSAWRALGQCTAEAAALFGLDGQLGSLAAGKWADLCCIEVDESALRAADDPLASLLFGAGRDDVSDVWVAGRQLLGDGELIRMDFEGVAARASGWRTRIRMGSLSA
jgi:5-methylthioadenosine/S-adenosylhomocysteine deaminase